MAYCFTIITKTAAASVLCVRKEYVIIMITVGTSKVRRKLENQVVRIIANEKTAILSI
jgi:protein involved in ribonucleotide reduction